MRAVRWTWIVVASLAAASARADDDVPAFDRPGLAFASVTLPVGAWAVEQGLPDASTDRDAGVRTSDAIADTLLRHGLFDGVELQLGVDTRGWERMRGPGGMRASAATGGDARVGVKLAVPGGSDAFSAALLLTLGVPVGRAPIGSAGHTKDLGLSMSWAVADGASVSLYLDHRRDRGGEGSLCALAYNVSLRDDLSAYVEGGFGDRAQHAREAGGGVAWMVTKYVQLDASFLRALDRATTDWQAGFGVSVFFDGPHS